ncbi:acyl-CoA thioesterase [Arenibacterium sp. LLYu02]|uniref:acyl-CoA thioesterase n=1 Tax=Arenibacterium sp. LLYu02 TaxID=3404132 RepID=UPI003B21E177
MTASQATPANPPETQPTIRVIAMPTDTNPAGDIFGGWLMSQMDLAAGTIAARVSKGRASTVSVEEIQFHRPVLVGDEVSLFAEMLKIGRTSMRIRVRAWRRARHQEETQQVTEAIFTFVALDEHARPRPVLREE